MPAELAALTQLRQLSLGRNPTTGGWQHLPSRLQLDLQRCGFGEVPADLAALPQLRQLSMEDNPITGARQRLPTLLSPALRPSIWVPVSDFVHNPPAHFRLWLTFCYSFAFWAWLAWLFVPRPVLFQWCRFALLVCLIWLFLRVSLHGVRRLRHGI